jgi:hypothetical protein
VPVHPLDAGNGADAVDDAADRMPVNRAAVISDGPRMGADVFKVVCVPLDEQRDQLWSSGT